MESQKFNTLLSESFWLAYERSLDFRSDWKSQHPNSPFPYHIFIQSIEEIATITIESSSVKSDLGAKKGFPIIFLFIFTKEYFIVLSGTNSKKKGSATTTTISVSGTELNDSSFPQIGDDIPCQLYSWLIYSMAHLFSSSGMLGTSVMRSYLQSINYLQKLKYRFQHIPHKLSEASNLPYNLHVHGDLQIPCKFYCD